MGRVRIALFGLLLFVYLLTMGGHTYAPDDESFFYVTESMLTHGGFDIPKPGDYPTVGGHRGTDGKVYAQSSLGQPLVAIPLYLIGRSFAAASPDFSYYLTRLIINLLNPLVTAALALVLFAYARTMGMSALAGAGLALIWGFCTYAWIEAKTFFNEPLMGLCLVLAFFLVRRSSLTHSLSDWFMAGVIFGLATLVRIHAAIAIPALVLYALILWIDVRPRTPFWNGLGSSNSPSFIKSILAFIIPVMVFVGIGALGYNWVRFGDPFEFGYGNTLHVSSLLVGVKGMLLSPGKSMFVFAPPVMLGMLAIPLFWRGNRAEVVAFSVYLISVILFHARVVNWASGGAWGDRYVYAAVALWVLPIGSWIDRNRGLLARIVLVGIAACGLAVQLPAVLVNFDTGINSGVGEADLIWTLEQSPVPIQFGLLSRRINDWLQVILPSQDHTTLLQGWSPSDGQAGDLFPRFIASWARVSISVDSQEPVNIRLALADFRPERLPRRTLRLWLDYTLLAPGVMMSGERGEQVYAVTIPAHHPRQMWLGLETVGSLAKGSGPTGQELGFQVRDMQVRAGNRLPETIIDMSIPPIPLAIPNAAWSWFYNPAIAHFDLWWWYILFTGLQYPLAWSLVLPLVGSSLIGLFVSARVLVRALQASPLRFCSENQSV